MDITTLPKEMLGNILKYNDYDVVFQLRKLNSFVDSTVTRYSDLKRIPVVRFELAFFDLKLHLTESVGQCYNIPKQSLNRSFTFHNKESMVQAMTTGAKRFTLNGLISLLQSEISDSLCSIRIENPKTIKNCTDLHLVDSYVVASQENIKKSIQKLPKLKNLIFSEDPGDVNSEKLFNLEVLGNRRWNDLKISSTKDSSHPNLNDQFLLEVAQNCNWLEVDCFVSPTYFTFQGVVNMVKRIVSLGPWDQFVRIGTVQLGDTPFFEVEGILRALDADFDCTEHESAQGRHSYYRLTFGYPRKQKYLIFDVKIPNDVE